MLVPVLLTGSVVASALAWGSYFAVKDRYQPEPRRLLVFVFLAGAAATGPAWLLYKLAEYAGFGAEIFYGSMGHGWRLLYCVAIVGAIEEGCKFFGVRMLIGRHREFDEPVDGIIYAAMGGLGFASVETLVVARFDEGAGLWARIAVSPLTHSLFAAVWGYTLSLDRFGRPRTLSRVFVGVAAAATAHGLYDFLLLSKGLARHLAEVLILGLWILLLLAVQGLLRRSPFRSTAPGERPRPEAELAKPSSAA